MSAEIRLDQVNKSYRETSAVRDVSLTVRPGEVLMLVGPSGCGKSTLLNLIAGLQEPTSGGISLDGRAVSGPGPDRAMVFQDGGLFPWLDVQQNVEFGLKQRRVEPKLRAEKARAMLAEVGLEGFERRPIHELSGGMRQRVAIARSLVLDPQVLLMDEPFSALDALTREDMYDTLQALWEHVRTTVVFVTHNVREAVTLGDRVAVLSHRPATVEQVYEIPLPRPRLIDDPEVATRAREISLVLKRGLVPGEVMLGADI